MIRPSDLLITGHSMDNSIIGHVCERVQGRMVPLLLRNNRPRRLFPVSGSTNIRIPNIDDWHEQASVKPRCSTPWPVTEITNFRRHTNLQPFQPFGLRLSGPNAFCSAAVVCFLRVLSSALSSHPCLTGYLPPPSLLDFVPCLCHFYLFTASSYSFRPCAAHYRWFPRDRTR